MNAKQEQRRQRLLPYGLPRYIRVYDNGGESADRYTVVFTGNNPRFDWIPANSRPIRDYPYLAMSENPSSPQGVCISSSSPRRIDRPKYGHLGKRIMFSTLPEACQKIAMSDYKYWWNIDQDA